MTMLLLLWSGMMHAQAVVTVVTTDGEKHATIITETGHVSIGNESVTLYATSDSNATSSYAIEDVAKMLFSTNMSVTKVTDEVRLNLYPNPSGDHFTVDGIGSGNLFDAGQGGYADHMPCWRPHRHQLAGARGLSGPHRQQRG